jgi:hypothetical protein
MWGLGLFCVGQLALNAALDRWSPELRDPEHVAKLNHLRTLVAQGSRGPLVLFLGSSRTLFGLQPGDMSAGRTTDQPRPLFFNFGLTGYGRPLAELLCLRRLLAEGLQPDWVFVEILPALLGVDGADGNPYPIRFLSVRDLALFRRHWRSAWKLYEAWGLNRLVPCFSFRFRILSSLAPEWLPPSSREYDFANAHDRQGWLSTAPAVSAARQSRMLQEARKEYHALLHDLTIHQSADRALRELLKLCRSRGIRVALYIMPEGNVFQSWYSPVAKSTVDMYLNVLCREFHVPFIDARDWIDEREFYDSHHLMRRGAREFSKRMGQVALQDIVAHPECKRALAAEDSRGNE